MEAVEEAIKTALVQAPVLHQDETGLYVKGHCHWMHVSSTKSLTYYGVHPKRGKEGIDALGILTHFRGTSVHDGFQTYQMYFCTHALCNVHHLRELTFVEEELGQPWAGKMKGLLLEMKRIVDQARAEGKSCLDQITQTLLRIRYQELIEEGYAANPHDPPPMKIPGRRRNRQSTARNLLGRLSGRREQVLRFLSDFAVPFDNNQAERDIRMVKVQQKISGCFRSEDGAQAFCRIRGYLSTMRKQGQSLLAVLEQAMSGHPVLPAF